MRWFNLLIMLLFVALMLYATVGLPDHADPQAPANTHVTPTYIEDTIKDTHTPNVVTSVLADYRGYDTLGETIVIFTAGLACILILMKRKANDKTTLSKRHRSDRM